MVSLTSLFVSVTTSFAIFSCLVLLYFVLSSMKQNYVVYYPARIIKGLGIPETKRFYTMLWEAWVAKEEDLWRAGVDSAVYVLFLEAALKICAFTALYGLVVLVPLCASDNFYEEYNAANPEHELAYDTFDKLSMGNISKTSNHMWAFIVGAYWLTLGSLYFLDRATKEVTHMLARYTNTQKSRPEQFTVLVQDIPPPPPGMSRADFVEEYFSRLYPDTFQKAVVCVSMGRVLKLWKELQRYAASKAHADAVLELKGKRLTTRTRFGGWCGARVDSIDWYGTKIRELRPVLEAAQVDTLENSPTAAAFVFFQTRAAAALSAQAVHAVKGDTWVVSPAPDPLAVRWGDVATHLYFRSMRKVLVWIAVSLLVVFFVIPVSAVSALTSLESLEHTFTFLVPLMEVPWIRSLLEAYLPQVALVACLAAIPQILYAVSCLEAYPTDGQLWVVVAHRFFLVLVFNVFLAFTVSGTLFDTLGNIVESPKEVVSLLGSAVPTRATFFITYTALYFFVGYGLELSRIGPLIAYRLANLSAVTDEERRAAWTPAPVASFLTVPRDLLILTLGLCYAVIAPMILPFTFMYFFFGLLVYRHQALNVYIPKWEGGGSMWPQIQNQVLFALTTAQLTLIGYFGLKQQLTTAALLPLPFITLFFAWAARKRFTKAFEYMPIEVAVGEPLDPPSLAHLVKAYTPECMHSQQVYEALGEPDAMRIEQQEREEYKEGGVMPCSPKTPLLVDNRV